MSNPIDIERAKAFLEKRGPVELFKDSVSTIFLARSVMRGVILKREWFNKEVTSEDTYQYSVIAILKEWLREQLRDGGKNTLSILEPQQGTVSVVCWAIKENKLKVSSEGHSDLDALIKAYDSLMELTQESDGEK